MLKGVELLYRQGIHVCTQADSFEFTLRSLSTQNADDTCFSNARFNQVAQLLKLGCDQVGCPIFFKAQFRVGMDVPP